MSVRGDYFFFFFQAAEQSLSIFSGLAKILSGSEAELEKKQREDSLAQQIPRKLEIGRNLDDKIISTAKVKIYQFQIIILLLSL